MIYEEIPSGSRTRRTLTGAARVLFALKIDGPLVVGLALIAAYGLVVLYSASGQSLPHDRAHRGAAGHRHGRDAAARAINPNFLRRSTPWLYVAGCFLLLIVAAIGHIGMGAQRWLDLGLFRFQPSELMKLAVPMMCAWYLHERPLPPSWVSLTLLGVLILVPVALVAMQPDLGTAALIAIAGALVIVLAGLRLRVMVALLALAAARGLVRLELHARLPAQARADFPRSADRPARRRLPHHPVADRDRLGRRLRQGLDERQPGAARVPARALDRLHLCGDRRGVRPARPALAAALYVFVAGRAIYLATQTQDTFARLLAGSLALTFFVYVFINAGMVTGLLPVVGVPLPLVSYGGSSVVTLLAGFGILMALYSRRKLVGS